MLCLVDTTAKTVLMTCSDLPDTAPYERPEWVFVEVPFTAPLECLTVEDGPDGVTVALTPVP